MTFLRRYYFLIGMICLLMLGCSKTESESTNPQGAQLEAKLKVVATTGMIGDVVLNIGQSRIELQTLMGPGVDPHLYKATEGDVMRLAQANIIFYNGLHLEAKMSDVFKNMQQRIKTVAVTESLDPSVLLSSEDYKDQFDPHVWFDVALWVKAAVKIKDAFIEIDPQHAELYEQNALKYMAQLEQLHRYVQSQSNLIPVQQRVLVTAHDAFRYFGRAYQFEVVGLQGISTESEAGTADVQRLVQFIVERKILAIFVESSIPERNIKAVQQAVAAQGWQVKIGGELFSDALGDPQTKEGKYLGMVEHNINTIVNALLPKD